MMNRSKIRIKPKLHIVATDLESSRKKSRSKDVVRMSFDVAENIHRAISNHAHRQGRSKVDVIRQAVKEYLSRHREPMS
ncbi:hypothetical protein [Leptolyngbya sp. 'hensonii']|uniref:hypothetical protein n=1 Tax=Leptolyngbya sp. 'hensonii' TaxID=1922337 RepID=UPI000AA989D5|nr:hypothetical protein [Leptolyngbya sp. 'hensonii']